MNEGAGTTRSREAATITDEQAWVEAAAHVLADAPAAEPIARLLAESLWPEVAPLVEAAQAATARAEDAEREYLVATKAFDRQGELYGARIQAVRDLCAQARTEATGHHYGGWTLLSPEAVLRALDGPSGSAGSEATKGSQG